MADNMMRIAGRGTDGNAKAVRADANGTLFAKTLDGRQALVSVFSDFNGKVAGRAYDVPHIGYRKFSATFLAPSSYTYELEDINYLRLYTRNMDAYHPGGTVTNGHYTHTMFKMDMLTIARRTFGISDDISAADLRTAIKKMLVSWVGYGVGASGGVVVNGATLKLWNNTTLAWDTAGTNTGASPSYIEHTPTTPSDYMDDSGYVYVLAHSTNATDGTRLSNLYTDYVSCQLTVVGRSINTVDNSASADLLTFPGYTKIADRAKYQVWETKGYGIRALYKNIAAYHYSSQYIAISTTGINGKYDNVVAFDSTNFPGLISGSTIEYLMLLPWTRNLASQQTAVNWRLVVITSKGQIYHNYPSRAAGSDGSAVAGDIIKFEESVVWDLAERKFPSTNPAASGVESYFPGLPSTCYEYHPILNTDAGYVDTYGNDGFGNSITKNSVTYPRFYIPKRAKNQNSFSPMGGFEPGDKLSIVGTYKGNATAGEGCRTCIFLTDDGGRSWYNKYEFASTDTSPAYGNAIDTSALTNAYTTDSFAFVKRTLVLPTAETKEPSTLFSWGSQVTINGITKANPAVVTTSSAHGLVTGNVIAIQDNTGSGGLSADWDWMRNETISEMSGGTGRLFKVEVINTTSFRLYEYVHSAFNNLPCRHVHGINKLKDGFIIVTGEEYPGGWTFYMSIKPADSYSVARAYTTYPIVRLTSSAGCVQRTIGMILKDDLNNTITFAMDSAIVSRGNLSLPSGRTDEVSRSSIGIFRGKLSDIDEFTKFEAIHECTEPAYFFKSKSGILIYVGQRFELALSFDDGATWQSEAVSSTAAAHYYGQGKGYIALGNLVIVLK